MMRSRVNSTQYCLGRISRLCTWGGGESEEKHFSTVKKHGRDLEQGPTSKAGGHAPPPKDVHQQVPPTVRSIIRCFAKKTHSKNKKNLFVESSDHFGRAPSAFQLMGSTAPLSQGVQETQFIAACGPPGGGRMEARRDGACRFRASLSWRRGWAGPVLGKRLCSCRFSGEKTPLATWQQFPFVSL